MLWGDIVDKLAFQRALRSHQDHADLRGYPLFLLQKPTIHNFWDKIYFMHWTLVEELAEPEEQRRRWLLWFDADSLILNPSAGLETFLPPENMSQIQFICTKDLNGLNSGVFLFRVSLLTAYYMAKIMAAMELVFNETEYRDHVVFVPKRWINGYAGDVQTGDLLVHFPGVGDRPTAIEEWLATIEKEDNIDMVREKAACASAKGLQVKTFRNEAREFRAISSRFNGSSFRAEGIWEPECA
ncbi:hypothetical protein AYO22_11776 [Fonsecaea multimorphosa]|nr:hypothetical protein AYO22_11776 [Fonsecaea multimorphosa]